MPSACGRICGALLCLVAIACSHPVTVEQRGYEPLDFQHSYWKSDLTVGVRPFDGTDPYTFGCYQSLVEALESSGSFGEVVRNYQGLEAVDLVVDIRIAPEYRVNRGKNFFIQWPGFLVFTPLWHGLVYTLRLHTDVSMSEPGGPSTPLLDVIDDYEIRYTSTGRGIATGFPIGWIFFGGISLLSNAYIEWDDAMRDDAYEKIDRRYAFSTTQRLVAAMSGHGKTKLRFRDVR